MDTLLFVILGSSVCFVGSKSVVAPGAERLSDTDLDLTLPPCSAVTSGAESVGLPDVAHGLFPRGGVELVDHFYTECNARLVTEMAEKRAAEQQADV